MSQVRDTILEHFQNGGTLTKITAIAPPFRTTSLLDKIHILRRAGWPIEKRWKKTESGSRYAEFYMERTAQ